MPRATNKVFGLIQMDNAQAEIGRKRKKVEAMEDNGGEQSKSRAKEGGVEEDTEVNLSGSEDMELAIAAIHEKLEHFDQLVSELLDSGKSLFNKLSNDFEERILMIHREQIEKWQEEMKQLKELDLRNEEINACLVNAKCVIQSVDSHH